MPGPGGQERRRPSYVPPLEARTMPKAMSIGCHVSTPEAARATTSTKEVWTPGRVLAREASGPLMGPTNRMARIVWRGTPSALSFSPLLFLSFSLSHFPLPPREAPLLETPPPLSIATLPSAPESLSLLLDAPLPAKRCVALSISLHFFFSSPPLHLSTSPPLWCTLRVSSSGLEFECTHFL
jgi:hypothetical protein